MRFEIGIGGGIVIGIGLLALSGGVFCLGLIGGYEIASQEQHNRDVAAVYPLPAQLPQTLPQGVSSPSSESITARAAAAASPTPGARDLSEAAPPAELPAAPKPAPPSVPKRVAAVAPPRSLEDSSTSTSSVPKPARPKIVVRKAAPTVPQGHQPFSVQIDAVMDRQGAENMARRLSAGGYQPYIVPTDIAGQTWYKVRVGHYETEEEAHDAEMRLKAQYEGSLPAH